MLWKGQLDADRYDVFDCTDGRVTYVHVDAFSVPVVRVAYRMRSVHLANNRLVVLHAGCFDYLPSLRYLGLSGNSLRVLERFTFAVNQRLEVVDLSNNQLVELRETFANLPRLRRLDLSGNDLTEFGREPFEELVTRAAKLGVLNIADNRFECGCDLKWLLKVNANPKLNIVDRTRKAGNSRTAYCTRRFENDTDKLTVKMLITSKNNEINKMNFDSCG